MHLSYPILCALVVDLALYSLLIAELALQTFLKGGAIVLQGGVRVHAVDSDHFKEFHNSLLSLTADNILAV